MSFAGKVDKTMEAESVGQLKHLIDTELARVRRDNGFDIVLFVSVNGRIFASSVPDRLDVRQYGLLSLVKGQLPYICSQLSAQNMRSSVQQYELGTVIIRGVGEKTFLVFLNARPIDMNAMEETLRNVTNAGAVMLHLVEERPITAHALAEYAPEIQAELKRLTRILFVEKFEETREYKRNTEVFEWISKRLGAVVGPGPQEEIATLALNEIGTSAAYMSERQWERFVELVVEEIRKLRGDVVAEDCRREWAPHVKRVLASFV